MSPQGQDPVGTGLQLRVFGGGDLPDELITRWTQLWSAMAIGQRTPFLHPATTVIAASVVPTTAVAVITQGDRPVAFLPFERRGGHGFPVAHDVSNGDGIVAEAGVELPMTAVVRGCGLRSLTWIHRDQLSSPLGQYDHYVAPAAMVDLSAGREVYEQRVAEGSSILTQTARKRRKLQREQGAVTFELDGDHALTRELLLQKTDNIRTAGGQPDFDMAIARPLVEAFGGQSPGTGLTSLLSVLSAGGEVIAMNWGIAAGGRFVSCIPAYDAPMGRYSPGQILHVAMIQALAGTDVELVDLGLGVDQTKQRLMTHTTPMAGGVVYASPLARGYRRVRTLVRRQLRGS